MADMPGAAQDPSRAVAEDIRIRRGAGSEDELWSDLTGFFAEHLKPGVA